MKDIQAAEVWWYRRNGKYSDRLKIDARFKPYLIGDVDWNKANPERREYVEAAMHAEIARLP